MVTHVLLDPLESGELPLYDFAPGREFYVWEAPQPIVDPTNHRVTRRPNRPGIWGLRRYGRRALLNTDIDEPLTKFLRTLPERLEALTPSFLTSPDGETLFRETGAQNAWETPGTLVVALRECCQQDFTGWQDLDGNPIVEQHGVLILGGLAFFPNVQNGREIAPSDLLYYLEQACLGIARKEYDQGCPGVRDFLVQCWQRHQDRADKRTEIEKRAREILQDHLDGKQLAEFEARREFHVVGADGYTYLITAKSIHNVFRVEAGVRTVEYCIVTEVPVPLYDQMLTQKLLLEADPVLFHSKTNAWMLDAEERTRVFLDPETFELIEAPAPV